MVDTLKFPLVGYRKENGFLGILYYDKEIDELVFSSKSRTHLAKGGNEYALRFKEIFESHINSNEFSNIGIVRHYLKNNNQSLVFEVMDIENDPHITEYEKSHVVLLDSIDNKLQFSKSNNEKGLKELANNVIGCDFKQKELVFNDWQEFYSWYKENHNNLDIKHEGWVFEDSNNFMFKFKSKWYSDWKYIRGVVLNLTKEHMPKRVHQHILQSNTDLRDFYYWAKQQPKETLLKDIITLRKEFYNENKS